MTQPTFQAWNSGSCLPGLPELKSRTTGHPTIRVAVIDTAIDSHHPLLSHHTLPVETPPGEHGTHIASVIAGKGEAEEQYYQGIAPDITLISIPVYQCHPGGQPRPCSKETLARAIHQACDEGAHLINVSGGDVTRWPNLPGVLTEAVGRAVGENRLVVAATGNNGAEMLHTPACLPQVLAVGAADWDSVPLPFSNYASEYQAQAVLAPGTDIPGAGSGGVIVRQCGTSFATPVVTGIAALLLSLQHQSGQPLNPLWIREMILASAEPAHPEEHIPSNKILAGRINVVELNRQFESGLHQETEKPITDTIMTDNTHPSTVNPSEVPAQSVAEPVAVAPQAVTPASTPVSYSAAPVAQAVVPASIPAVVQPVTAVLPSAAPVAQANGQVVMQPVTAVSAQQAPQSYPASVSNPRGGHSLVYCLGSVGFDFQIEARMDYFIQRLASYQEGSLDERMFRYVVENDEWDNSELLTWTVKVDGTPVYAIQPIGSGRRDLYKLLVSCLYYQLPPEKRPDIGRDFFTIQQSSIAQKHGLTKDGNGQINIECIREKDRFDYHRFVEEEVKLHQLAEFSGLLVDQVAVAGVVAGEAKLYNGTVVPLLEVAISGICPWNKSGLIEQQSQAAMSSTAFADYVKRTSGSQSSSDDRNETIREMVHDSIERALEKVYHEFKNNGVTDDERAINYVGTNILTLVDSFVDVFEVVEENGKISTRYEFENAVVEHSKVQRPTSLLKDVVLRFFEPGNLDRAYKCYRFTVDVSDVNPVIVEGKPKVFYESRGR